MVNMDKKFFSTVIGAIRHSVPSKNLFMQFGKLHGQIFAKILINLNFAQIPLTLHTVYHNLSKLGEARSGVHGRSAMEGYRRVSASCT